jgi:lysophospholipase L1-like esterase
MSFLRCAVRVLLTCWVLGFLSGNVWCQPNRLQPEHWEKDVAAFESRDRRNPPGKGGIVFVGSSSIRLWKTLEADFPNHRVLNRGFGGSQLSDLVYYADRLVLAYAPSFVVVYSGVNDINVGKKAEEVLQSFRELVAKIRARQPETPIAYLSIAGNSARWSRVNEVRRANALIEAFTKQNPNLLFVDVFSAMLGPDGQPRTDIFVKDGLHMNAAGYEIWRNALMPHLPPAEARP